jgi:hypothetical protein
LSNYSTRSSLKDYLSSAEGALMMQLQDVCVCVRFVAFKKTPQTYVLWGPTKNPSVRRISQHLNEENGGLV